MFLWMVLSSSSFYFFQLFSSNISRNGKSINSQRFHCQSYMPLCSVVTHSCRSTLEGVFPLETSPPSGCAPSPPTDSVSQWLWILPGISGQKKKQKRHFKFSRGVVRYSFAIKMVLRQMGSFITPLSLMHKKVSRSVCG